MFSRLADKFKRKGQEEKFEVTLRISTLSPWPSTGKFKRLCVRWERGSKRSGTTKPVLGADDPTQRAPGKGFHMKYDFRETVAFPVTLYKEADGLRKYAKKTLTLTVCEVVDISGRNPTDVGSIVLNLAEFASTDGMENERRLPLACSSAITAACGQPVLSCTISVKWSKTAGSVAGSTVADSDEDDDDDDKPAAKPAPKAAAPPLFERSKSGGKSAAAPSPPPRFDDNSDSDGGGKPPGGGARRGSSGGSSSDDGDPFPPPPKTAPKAAAPPPPKAAPAKPVPQVGVPQPSRYDSDGFLLEDDESAGEDSPPPKPKPKAAPAKVGDASRARNALFGTGGDDSDAPAPAPAKKKGTIVETGDAALDKDRASLFADDAPAFRKKTAPASASKLPVAGSKMTLGRTASSDSLSKKGTSAAAPVAPPPQPPAGKKGRRGSSEDDVASDSDGGSDSDAAPPPPKAPPAAAPAAKGGSARGGKAAAPPAPAPARKGGKAKGSSGSESEKATSSGSEEHTTSDDSDSDRAPAKPRAAAAAADSSGDEEPQFASAMFTKGGKKGGAAPAAKQSKEKELVIPPRGGRAAAAAEAAAAAKAAAAAAAAAAAEAEEKKRREEEEAEERRWREEAEAKAAAAAEAARRRAEEEAADAAAEAAREARLKTERKAARRAKADADAPSAKTPGASARSRGGRSESPSPPPPAAPAPVAAPPAASGPPASAAAQAEMVDVAALELSLLTAVPHPGGEAGAVHGAARGMVHALRCVAPAGAGAMARRTAHALASAVLACGDAPSAAPALLFWASNAAALRAALQLRAVWEADVAPSPAVVSWLETAAGAAEAAAVAAASRGAWSAGPAVAATSQPAPPPRGHSADDALASHWLAALDAAERALSGSAAGAPPPPMGVFAPLPAAILASMLNRLDVALLNALLADPGAKGVPAGADAITARGAAPGGGSATFGAGVAVKMLCQRLASWAQQRRLSPPPGTPRGPGGEAGFFPLLRAAADVLMMPKASLSAADVRADVAGALPPAALRALLSRFAPDADSPEGVPPALLAALEAAAPAGKAAKRPGAVLLLPPQTQHAPVAAASCGVDWLDFEGFPLDEDGLNAAMAPLAVLLGRGAGGAPPGFDPAGPPGAAAEEARFTALRAAWGV